MRLWKAHRMTLLLIAVPVLIWPAFWLANPAPARAQSHAAVTKETFDQWMTEMSNWGRWGKDDQMGTMNLITPAKRKQGFGLAKEGVSFSMARDVEKDTAIDNPSPFVLKMGVGRDGVVRGVDQISVSYHGYIHTHMDALCHFSYNGRVYNGFSEREILTAQGALKNSINAFKGGIATRGVLVDLPLLKGVDYLEPGTHIYPEDLDAWEKKAHLKISSGDIVFFRTGRWARRDKSGPWDTRNPGMAGLDALCLKWIKQRDIALVASDAVMDVMPSGVEGVVQPIHTGVLVAMGTPIFDNCDLELVSREANRRQRWEFLITASPLAIQGGTGSPLNPIATF
jgi:kynurenine formamidase